MICSAALDSIVGDRTGPIPTEEFELVIFELVTLISFFISCSKCIIDKYDYKSCLSSIEKIFP